MLPHSPVPEIWRFCLRVDNDFAKGGHNEMVIPNFAALARMDRERAKVGHILKGVLEGATKLRVRFSGEKWERDNTLQGSGEKPGYRVETPGRRFKSLFSRQELRQMDLQGLSSSLRIIR